MNIEATKTKHGRANRSEEMDLDALLAGDQSAFEQLVVGESERLFRVIARIVNDDEEAQNILQETFLQAYQRLDTFRRESKLTTWLYAIGINLARASLRKSRRTSPLSEADLDRLQPAFTRGMFQQSSEDWNPQKVAEKSDLHRIVHDAIQQLPEDYRTIVTLRDIEEYSTEETARMLNISSGAVRVRLHRARQALRSLLDPQFH
jgi:RNA polymerase sigma-70 factor (ECF subfamily)